MPGSLDLRSIAYRQSASLGFYIEKPGPGKPGYELSGPDIGDHSNTGWWTKHFHNIHELLSFMDGYERAVIVNKERVDRRRTSGLPPAWYQCPSCREYAVYPRTRVCKACGTLHAAFTDELQSGVLDIIDPEVSQ